MVGDTYELDMDSALLDAIGRLNKQDKAEVAHFIIDPVVLFILGATSRRSLTVSEMAPSINLPIATCYKLVYQMESFGLMMPVDNPITVKELFIAPSLNGRTPESHHGSQPRHVYGLSRRLLRGVPS